MIAPLAELLSRMRPHLSEVLVSEKSFARSMAIAEALPEISGGFCLECRLGEGQSRVDYLACASSQDGGREAFPVPPPAALGGPLWERVAAFWQQWRDPASVLHERVPVLWLEFDMDRPDSPLSRPLAFACIQPWLAKGPPARRGPLGTVADQGRPVAWRALELLGGAGLAPGIQRAVTACFEHLPEGAHVLHVAPLTSRGVEATRVVTSMHKQHMSDYLRRIGWPGVPEEVAALLERKLEFWNHVDLNVDVQESVLPDIGLGWQLPDAANDSRTRRLLDALVEEGVCTPDKRDALLRWPGREKAVLDGYQWPTTLWRTLGFKLVHRPGAPLEAKAYLYFENRFSLVG